MSTEAGAQGNALQFLNRDHFQRLLVEGGSGITSPYPGILGLEVGRRKPFLVAAGHNTFLLRPSDKMFGPDKPGLDEVEVIDGDSFDSDVALPKLIDMLLSGTPGPGVRPEESMLTPFGTTRNIKSEIFGSDDRFVVSGVKVAHPLNRFGEYDKTQAYMGPPEPDHYISDEYRAAGLEPSSYAYIDNATGNNVRVLEDKTIAYGYEGYESVNKIKNTRRSYDFFDPTEAGLPLVFSKGVWRLPAQPENVPLATLLMYKAPAAVQIGNLFAAEIEMMWQEPELTDRMLLGPLALYRLMRALRTAHLGGPELAHRPAGRDGFAHKQLHGGNAFACIDPVTGHIPGRPGVLITDMETCSFFRDVNKNVPVSRLHNIRFLDTLDALTPIWENTREVVREKGGVAYFSKLAVFPLLGCAGVLCEDLQGFADAYQEHLKLFEQLLQFTNGDYVRAAQTLLISDYTAMYGPESISSRPKAIKDANDLRTMIALLPALLEDTGTRITRLATNGPAPELPKFAIPKAPIRGGLPDIVLPKPVISRDEPPRQEPPLQDEHKKQGRGHRHHHTP